jgi:hypothetical protein
MVTVVLSAANQGEMSTVPRASVGRPEARRRGTRRGRRGGWLMQITGCLSAVSVDAMSGMVSQVRPSRRDEMNACRRALLPGLVTL